MNFPNRYACGAHCESPPDPCLGVACGEHGACVGSACACDEGFSGDACEVGRNAPMTDLGKSGKKLPGSRM